MSAKPFWRRQWFAALGIALVLVVVLVAAARGNPTSTGGASVSAWASAVTTTGTVRATIESSPAAASLTPTKSESPTVVASTAAQQSTPSSSAPTATGLPGGLTQLVVAPQDTAQVYVRAYFGDGWIDADHDCQDTRAEVLIAESTAPVTFTTSSNCTVATGRWVDPWSGVVVTSATQVQIDHDVPLAEAWRSGAWAWTTAERIAYANDLSYGWHLNAVTNSENTSKSDSDPAHWKPPLQSTWCLCARAWTTIKAKYGLTADQAEWSALLTMAPTCAA
jgi:hypothetical protein